MDYLDSAKQLRHHIVMMVGYLCIAVAIVMGTLILLYQAYGFGLGKHGTVIQNSLAFFSSQPSPANIYINGTLRATTNTRLTLQSGVYHVTLSRNGYRTWQRTIELDGGSVNHYDYPFLVPQKLIPKKLTSYSSAPGLVTESPDRRWLLAEEPGSMTTFHVFDLKTPTKAPVDINLPTGILSKATASENWQLDEWADDNQHLVLTHTYDSKTEFILLNRTDPGQSVNLNTSFSVNPNKLTLKDKKYDQYYLYDAGSQNLQAASLANTTPATVLTHVVAYHSYAADTLLYITDSPAPSGKVVARLLVGTTTYTLHSFPAGTNYLLDLTKYSGTMYVAIGMSSENKVYIYKDPVGQLAQQTQQAVAPVQVLHVIAPDYLSFSANAQYIVAEHGTQFGVYDILNTKGFSYTSKQPLDTPQLHASWMDGNRITYVSQGKVLIFDYDNTNRQLLLSSEPSYIPAFNQNYHFMYTVAPSTTTPGQFELTQTALLIPSDQ